MPFHDVENAALAHLRNWAGGGSAAPEYRRIEMRDGDVVRDEHGNARVESASRSSRHRSRSTARWVRPSPARCVGSSSPSSATWSSTCTASRATYLRRFDDATTAAVDVGYLLATDAREGRALAERAIDELLTS